MRRFAFGTAVIVLLGVAASAQQSQQPVGTGGTTASMPVVVTPDAVNWGPAPEALPAGSQLAVLSGDPMSTGAYAVRLKMPDGYKIAPHWHPTVENVTVIEGTFLVGMGDQFSETSLKSLATGSYAQMPQHMNHYAMAKGATTIQIEGMGPFQLTYVNPSDDPRTKK